MMQHYRRKYPESWETMARASWGRTGWKCEMCGAAQHTIRISKRGNPYIVYLAACHVNHDQDNPEPQLRLYALSVMAGMTGNRDKEPQEYTLNISGI